MREKAKEIMNNILGSLNTGKDGYSARKLTAFFIIACVIAGHVAWLKYAFMTEDFSLWPEILIIDYSFVAALLGMTTYQYIKQGKKDDTKA